MHAGRQLLQRAESLRFRIRGLSRLRQLVDLPKELDITDRQWSVLEPQLTAASVQLTSRLKAATSQFLPRIRDVKARIHLNAALGRIELDMSKGFTFFDTYMDVLTQRRPRELGRILAGCDVLAYDALHRNHPAL